VAFHPGLMRTSSASCEDVLAHLPSDRKVRYPVAVDVSSLESAGTSIINPPGARK
jgi:hypothetical protein